MQEQTNTGMVNQVRTSNAICRPESTGQGKPGQGTDTVEEINSDFDELCFESIQVDSSNFKPVRDEAFAKIQVDLPHIDHPNPMLKVKVDSGAKGNVLSLHIYTNTFPGQVDEDGLQTGTTPSQTKLTAYKV